jgi:efflux transporter, outer membrane factor (OMF) lipoprotein, NodT family
MEETMGKWWIGVFLLGVSSCVKVPEHELAGRLDSCGIEGSRQNAMDSGLFVDGDGPQKSWWLEFQDETLTQLIETALKSNPSLKQAGARLNAAAELALQKKAALFPHASFDPNDIWQHYAKDGFFRTYAPDIPAMVNDVMIYFTFTYEFDFWGKNRNVFRAALGEMRAREAEQKQAELLVTTSIAYTYEELQFLIRKKKILEEQENLRKQIERIRERREKHALESALIRLDSKSNTLDVAALLRKVSPKIEEHIHMLHQLAGLTEDEAMNIEWKPQACLEVSLPSELSLNLLARRPDLAALKARVEAAAKRIDAAKTDFYPNVNLTSLIGLESVFWSKLFGGKTYSGSLQPALHLPIFTAGKLKAQLMQQVAEFNEATYAYNALILQAAKEVADALTDLVFLTQETDIRRHSLSVAKEQEGLTKKRLDHAIDDQIAWLKARYKTLEMDLQVVSLEYATLLEKILLIRALGGGYCDGT